MAEPPDVAVYFDSGPGAGMGHERRMQALATALEHRGMSVALATDDEPVAAAVVVVDSYIQRADDRQRFAGSRRVAVDDLSRDLDVDLLVAPGGTTAQTSARRRVVTGLDYALLDPGLAGLAVAASGGTVNRVLVTTGAMRGQAASRALATALVAALPTAQVRMVVGPWDGADPPAGVVPVTTRDGLARELVAADLVVTAGGVTLLEALALGRPTVAVCTADNQRLQLDLVAAAGAALVCDIDEAVAAAVALAEDVERRRGLAAAARAAVDGRGAQRVAQAIERLLAGPPRDAS